MNCANPTGLTKAENHAKKRLKMQDEPKMEHLASLSSKFSRHNGALIDFNAGLKR